jgi:hypothetical protein
LAKTHGQFFAADPSRKARSVKLWTLLDFIAHSEPLKYQAKRGRGWAHH